MGRSLKVNGVDVKFDPKWNVKDLISSRSSFSFSIIDKGALTDIDIGMSVEFYRDSTELFKGFISEVSDYEAFSNYVVYTCKAGDNSMIASWRTIAAVLEGETAYDIVVDHLLPILAEEGVTIGNIQGDGIVIEKANYPYLFISDALDELCDIAGYVWYIDMDKKLYFHRRDEFPSTVSITDESVVKSFKRKRKYGKYRNIEYGRAGEGETVLQPRQEPTPKPDGVSRTFLFKFPIAKAPTVYINSVALLDTDIGVLNVDENKKYYWQYGSNLLTQDDSETVLSDTDVIDMDYIGLYPILTVADDADEITSRATIEGGSGKHEHLTVNKSINNNNQSLQYSQSQIELYADIPDDISFTYYESGISAGQLLAVNKSIFGINDNFLIKSVTVSAFSNQLEQYKIVGTDGVNVGGWERFFKDILLAGKKFILGDNELVIVVSTQVENETHTGTVYLNLTETGLLPSPTLSPSTTLLPSVTLSGEEILND